MSTWQHVPGVVIPCSVVAARFGALAASSVAQPPFPARTFDADITSGYVETLLRHCSHSFHYGVATHIVLCGDAEWYQGLMPNVTLSLAQKFILSAQQLYANGGIGVTPSKGDTGIVRDGIIQLSGGTFDVDPANPRFNSNVVKIDIRPSDPVDLCRRVTGIVQSGTASDGKRIYWIRASVPDYCGCEVSSTMFVLPPFESMSWEVHQYLRRAENDLLISRNALTLFVAHFGCTLHQELMSEVVRTLEKQKERLCAAIPNTPAAKYLLSDLDGSRGEGASSGGKAIPSQVDMDAMEAELASLRAACIAVNNRNQQLEKDVRQLKDLLTQQQAMHSALLGGAPSLAPRMSNADGGRPSVGMLLPPMERRTAKGGDGARAMIPYEQRSPPLSAEGKERNLLAVDDFVNRLNELTEIVGMIQSSQLVAAPNDVLRSCLLWRQKESDVLLQAIRIILSGATGEAATVSATPQPLSIGASTGMDPLTEWYRLRMAEMEKEMVRLADIDVDCHTATYYTEELEKMEHEVVGWMTKYFNAKGI